MRIRILLLFLASLLSLVGCTREALNGEDGEMVKLVISSSTADATKTYIGVKSDNSYPVYWSDGDRIAVNGVASAQAVISPTDKSKATFEAEVPAAENYSLIYPYTEGNASDEVTFSGASLPMYATTSGLQSNVTFNPLFCVLRFKVSTEWSKVNISSIVLSTQDSSQVCGKFKVGSDGTLTGMEPKATELVITPETPIKITMDDASPAIIDIPVPAGTYNILNVVLVSGNGSMTKKIGGGGNYVVSPGKVKEFNEFDYESNSNLFVIMNGDDLNQFAKIVRANDGQIAGYEGAKVLADITAPEDWTPLDFKGSFDGNNKTITLTKPLFGTLTDATITKVNLSADMTNSSSEANFGALAELMEGSSSVSKCSVGGTVLLNLEGNSTADTFNFAGLVGAVNGGSVSGCSSAALVQMNHPGTGAKTVQMGTMAGTVANGAAISNCKVLSNMIKAKDGNGNSSVKVNIGGIAGNVDAGATVQKCTLQVNTSNSIAVSIGMSVGTCRAGGIAGLCSGTIEDCVCEQSVQLWKANQEVSYVYVGGIAGAVTGATLSGCSNSGMVYCGNSSGKTKAKTVQLREGGIVGTMSSASTISNCTNSGKVEYNGDASKATHFAIGGVLGYADQAINVDAWKNTGSLLIAPVAPALGASGGWRVGIGGLVGLVPSNTITISTKSSNNGAINVKTALAPTTSYSYNYAFVGGCIGCFRGTAGTYSLLENTGDITISTDGESADIDNVCAGGIIGHTSAGKSANAIFDGCMLDCSIINKANGTTTGPAMLCAWSGSNKVYKNCNLKGSINGTYLKESNYMNLCFLDTKATDGGGNTAPTAAFTMGTYNLWAVSAREAAVTAGAAQERLWSNSKDAVVQYITDMDLDMLGVQEADPEQISYLTSELEKDGLGYSQILFWPDADHSAQSADGIFYRSKRFELVDYHQYWISETPEKQSKGWDETSHYRTAGYCHFYDRIAEKHFVVTVTHGPLHDEAREHCALLMKQYEQNLNTNRYPAFFIGDMNANADASPEDPFNTVMRAYCDDAYWVAEQIAEKTPDKSYTFVGSSSTAAPSKRIDYVYIHSDEDEKPYAVKEYAVGVDKYDISGTAFYPSDHFPVYIKVIIK